MPRGTHGEKENFTYPEVFLQALNMKRCRQLEIDRQVPLRGVRAWAVFLPAKRILSQKVIPKQGDRLPVRRGPRVDFPNSVSPVLLWESISVETIRRPAVCFAARNPCPGLALRRTQLRSWSRDSPVPLVVDRRT